MGITNTVATLAGIVTPIIVGLFTQDEVRLCYRPTFLNQMYVQCAVLGRIVCIAYKCGSSLLLLTCGVVSLLTLFVCPSVCNNDVSYQNGWTY